jgi:hypothetical protein
MNDLRYREPHSVSEKFYAIYLMAAIFVPITLILNPTFFSRPSLAIFFEISICLFYFLSGFNYWFSPEDKKSRLLVEISLLTQSIQIYILGLAFLNYYGIWIGVGFTDTPDWTFNLRFDFFTARVIDDFYNSNEISVYVNLVTITLYIYFIKMINRKTTIDSLFKEE